MAKRLNPIGKMVLRIPLEIDEALVAGIEEDLAQDGVTRPEVEEYLLGTLSREVASLTADGQDAIRTREQEAARAEAEELKKRLAELQAKGVEV